MTIFNTMHSAISAVWEDLRRDGTVADVPASFSVEPPRDAAHGDMATNIALLMGKTVRMPPRQLAEILVEKIRQLPQVLEAEIAGPGFINMRLRHGVWHAELVEMLTSGTTYGSCNSGQGARVNIEFVSANPTGPMHAGHVRGAVIGDTLSNLLVKAGYAVTREYYFNDAGTQVDVLARTAYLRYREALGEDIGAIPEGLYPGEYLREVGSALVERDGKKWLSMAETEWLPSVRDFAVAFMMDMIRKDLALIGINYDVFTNEREIISNGTLDKAFSMLDGQGLIYTGTLPPPKGKTMEDWEPAPLVLFRSSKFGDSTDRPLKKRDGNWAYIMPDIAYHYDKVSRGFSHLINVLGTDHGGYQERIRPVVAAFSDGKARLDVIYNNIVKVLRNGEPVKLSKRSGNIITLREMVEQVGSGAVRFFMLSRVPESELEFDFAKVVEQTRDNPVFYVQYAHARCCSVLRHAAEMVAGGEAALSRQALAHVDVTPLNTADDLALIRVLANWSRVVESAAIAREPHRVAFYLMELAAAFHSLWHKGNDNATLRFLIADNMPVTMARLTLLKAVQTVIASGLEVMGCTPLEELRSESL